MSLEQQQRELVKVIGRDYGDDDVFAAHLGETLEFKTQEYTYKLNFFDKVMQTHTRLGNWKEWGKKFSEMVYDEGERCWNGPARSTHVHLVCSDRVFISSVEETSKCVYKMVLNTPASCSVEEKEALELELSGAIQFGS